jgi:hypothetical protein
MSHPFSPVVPEKGRPTSKASGFLQASLNQALHALCLLHWISSSKVSLLMQSGQLCGMHVQNSEMLAEQRPWSSKSQRQAQRGGLSSNLSKTRHDINLQRPSL